ncbi:MAG: DUF58 domain-containing protein [Pseudomonadota bacterium]
MRRFLYLALRATSALDHRLRERLTPGGWLALGIAGAAFAAGLDTEQTVTYRAFAFVAALLALSWIASLAQRAPLKGLSARRELPRHATAGEPFVYRVVLANRGTRAVHGATLAERFRDPRPAFDEWRRAREPGEERRNWWDRNVGYFRWRWLIERRLPREARAVPLPALAPGERATLVGSFVPRRRGRIELAGFTLARPDPLGLVKSLARIEAPARVLVLPRRYRLPELVLPGRRKFQPGGVSLAVSVGEAEEFLALREYRPGDPLQRVHWKSFARTGKPIVREYQDEFFERHALVLDTAGPNGEDAAFEEAVALAASFVTTLDTHECLLDLLFVGDEVHTFTAGRGQMQPEHLLEVLAGVGPGDPGAFARLAGAVMARRATLSSVIVILLAWDEARRGLVSGLRACGLEVRALLVREERAAPASAPAGVMVLNPGRIEEGLARLR